MKSCNPLLVFLTVALLLGMVSCKDIFGNQSESDINVPNTYPVISGKVDVPIAPDPAFGWAPAPGSVNLGEIKARSGSGEPTLVAIGGSLTAGYRDGGLFREGQITAYPHLVARQMGLANFKQPLFEQESGNGTGRLVLESRKGTLHWKEASNNLAERGEETLTFKPYQGSQVNNFAYPGMGANLIALNPTEELARSIAYEKEFNRPSYYPSGYLWDKHHLPMSRRYISVSCRANLAGIELTRCGRILAS